MKILIILWIYWTYQRQPARITLSGAKGNAQVEGQSVKLASQQSAVELALLVHPKEFQDSEVGFISLVRKVWRLMSEVLQCLICGNECNLLTFNRLFVIWKSKKGPYLSCLVLHTWVVRKPAERS
jgi:hypothetical protein